MIFIRIDKRILFLLGLAVSCKMEISRNWYIENCVKYSSASSDNQIRCISCKKGYTLNYNGQECEYDGIGIGVIISWIIFFICCTFCCVIIFVRLKNFKNEKEPLI